MAARSIKIAIAYFSPTGGGKKIALAMREFYQDACMFDVTKKEARATQLDYTQFDLLFFVFPTYAQTIPKVIKHYLKQIQFPALFVPVNVYGNIKYGSSVKIAARIARKRGAKVIGGAAFVGAHSYNNVSQGLMIAFDRPDENDLKDVTSFCQLIDQRVEQGIEHIRITGHRNPLAFLIPDKMTNIAVCKPKIQKDKCQNCNTCKQSCPLDVINDQLALTHKCIRCYACAASCPVQARKRKVRFPLTRIYLSFFGRRRKENKIF